MTAPQLRSALGSTLLNSLANNLEFQTEIKPKCAVIINSALKADQIAKLGVGFDLRFLSTYDASELPTGFDICEYYSDLANQLGVGPHAPLQWLCQLAIDRFKAYAKADLDAEIQRITRKLRIRK
jgi:hypothetical protein